jgi:two-component system cell cycle sensor histidine kinase/response regulator CckA
MLVRTPETILVVEDDPGLARLQKIRLERSGFTTLIAGTFEEALEAVRNHPIDLVLLDFQLPGGHTGLDVQTALTTAGFAIPVVVVTGHHDEATVIKALRAGVRDFVTKSPTYLDYLVDVVERVLSQVRTERQLDESQALLSGVVESTIDAIIALDENHRITLFNSAAEQMFGCAASEALGQTLERFTFSECICNAEGNEFPDEKDVSAPSRSEIIGAKADGTRFPLEATVSAGSVGGRRFQTIVLRDLTAQKNLEETLRDAESRLRQKQKLEAVGSLAGGIAHEFNNLLQAILGYARYAMQGLEPNEQRFRDLEQVIKAGDRASTLTKQLLSFSRRSELHRANYVVKRLVDESVELLRPLLGENIELLTSSSADETSLHVDSGEFQQVLLNLCINARDAMPAGGRLSIACETVDLQEVDCIAHPGLAPGKHVLLTVADTGQGIPPNVQDRIFEPFFTTKEVGKGTGLGLAMVHGMVSQHQGTISVYSELGRGTTFRIYLPAAEGQAAEGKQALTESTLGGSETILVVEDDPLVRQLAERILHQAGYHTIAAKDGEDALCTFLEHADEIALVLTDIVMPKMGGIAFYHRLTELGANVPVVFSSGHAPQLSDAEVIWERQLPLVHKPYASVLLLRTIRETLDAHRGKHAGISTPSSAAPAMHGRELGYLPPVEAQPSSVL